MTRQDCYEFGKILKTHSFKGEYLISYNNRFEEVLEDSESIFVCIDGLLVPFFVEYIQLKTNTTAIVKFDTIHHEKQAHEFVGCTLWLLKSKVKKALPETKHDLLDYIITDKKLGELGSVVEIIDIPQNNLFRVMHQNKELLIPANQDFIQSVDHKRKTISIHLPEGFMDIND